MKSCILKLKPGDTIEYRNLRGTVTEQYFVLNIIDIGFKEVYYLVLVNDLVRKSIYQTTLSTQSLLACIDFLKIIKAVGLV